MELHTEIEMTHTQLAGMAPSSADQLVREFYQQVHYFAHSILDDVDDADDVAQEALIIAMSSLAKYRGEAAFKTWLYSITLNLCRQHFRKLRSRRTLAVALKTIEVTLDSQLVPEDIVTRNEIDRRLWAAVDALDEDHRIVIVLRYVHDLAVKEIAFIMKTKEGTIHSRLHRARQNLQRLLGDKKGYGKEVLR